MKKKVFTFMLLFVVTGIVMLLAHEIGRHIQSNSKQETTETTEVQIDYSLYYTYSDVENVVSYLADTTAESEALSRLIDPLKKSQVIDVGFLKSVAKAISLKESIYADVVSGKEEHDFVTKEEFETFYEKVVASSAVKGLLRQDLLVLCLEEDKTSFYDGHDTYHSEFELKENYAGCVIDVYMKNGMIFKVNGLGQSSVTLPNVWVKQAQSGSCTFLYGAMEQTYPATDDVVIPEADVSVATRLDAENVQPESYETEGYVADLVFEQDRICSIQKPDKVLRGKVISTGDTDVQVENIGGLTLSEDYKIYNVYEDVVDEESLSLLLGYSYVDFYLDEGKIGTIVINQELNSQDIRVIINNDDYTSYEMETVELTANTSFTVVYPDESEKTYAAGEHVTFLPDAYEPEDVITITPDLHSGRIQLLQVSRECGNPQYDGTIELDVHENYFYIINELSLERYLANVVANAMPSDYPEAAMQAMAICARGIAYAKLEDKSYEEYGAHLDDSSLCQVYNNIEETDESVRAVKDTYGLVPTYRGTLIVPMTFHTSFGTTCTNAEIWGGDAYAYLESNVENLKKDKIDLSKEEDFIAFLNDSEQYDIIDKDSDYYRWNIAFTKEEMTDAVLSVLEKRKGLISDTILVENENGEFVPGEISNLGMIESIEVSERTVSGVVSTLVIRGSSQTISVSGQSMIRAILSPKEQDIVRQDGSVVTGWTSLPSPYYYVENQADGFVVHGGGFGHGAGMSIYGAGVLGRQGKSYKYILRHYFSYVDFASIYHMDTGEEEPTGVTSQK